MSNSTKTNILRAFALLLLGYCIVSLTGCAQTGRYTGSAYEANSVRRSEGVRYGTITNLEATTIHTDNNGLGLGEAIGAIGGAVAGSALGGGRGQVLTTIGGAVLGAAAGGQISKSASKLDGVRISLKMDDGSRIAVVQEDDEHSRNFRRGDRVSVYTSGGTLRVAR